MPDNEMTVIDELQAEGMIDAQTANAKRAKLTVAQAGRHVLADVKAIMQKHNITLDDLDEHPLLIAQRAGNPKKFESEIARVAAAKAEKSALPDDMAALWKMAEQQLWRGKGKKK